MDRYAIFRGRPQMMPFQLGITADFARASDLMNRMNARIPGDYFIRDVLTHEVVASVQSVPCEGTGESAQSSDREPVFDIFCGVPDKNATWYETVAGLANARLRMEQLARIRPGAYFVFSRQNRSILVVTDTTSTGQTAIRPNAAVA